MVIKIKNPLYNSDLNCQQVQVKVCLDSTTMIPFGCLVKKRVDFDDYCDSYNKLFNSKSCNKNNTNFYLNTNPVVDYWNQTYDCLKKSKGLHQMLLTNEYQDI